jgi:DNA-binding NtrC family response regulator
LKTTVVYEIRKNGKIINQGMLDAFEDQNFSEEYIARSLGITRKALYKIRKKMGWPQKSRSDKGKPRKNV